MTITFLVFTWLSYPNFRAVYLLTFKFQETKGKIISSEIKEIKQLEGDEAPREVTAFIPVFKYQYEVGGKKITGTRYRASNLGKEKIWAQNIVEQFPANNEATIFYNPEKPEKSVLTKELPGGFWNNLFGLITLFLLTIVVALKKTQASSDEREDEPRYKGFENLVKSSEH